MRLIVPEYSMLLIDRCKRDGAEVVWKQLASGELPSSHWDLKTGEFRAISKNQWARGVRVVEKGGKVVNKHPVELLDVADTTWLVSYSNGLATAVGNDPVIVPDFSAVELSALVSAAAKMDISEVAAETLEKLGIPHSTKGGAPIYRGLPGRDWYRAKYRERGYTREGKRLKEICAEIERATGVRPGPQTVRDWENEEKNARTATTERHE